MRAIFVKPNTPYQPYFDVWRLVELAGYPTCAPEKVQAMYLPVTPGGATDTLHRRAWSDPETVFVCTPMNGEYPPDFPNHLNPPDPPKCKFVHWNLERAGYGTPPDPRFDEEWRSDFGWAEDGAKLGSCRYVPLGSDERLSLSGLWEEWIYDVITLSYMSGRRQGIIPHLVDYFGWKVPDEKGGLWGTERHEALLRTRYMLAIHQDDHDIIEPLRFAIAAAYGMDVLTEYAAGGYAPWKVEEFLAVPQHKGVTLPSLVRLSAPEHGFKYYVEEALKEMDE